MIHEGVRWKWTGLLGLLGLVALGVGGLGIAKRLSAKVDSLGKEVARLRDAEPQPQVVVVREVARERVASDVVSAQRAPVPIASNDTQPADPELVDEKKQQQATARVEARAKAYLDAHAKEPRDAEWAAWAAQTLQQAFSAEEFQALHIATDCRTTMCRIDTSYSDPALGRIANRAVAQVHPWPGIAFSKIDPEARAGYGILVREGFELPEPSPSETGN